jgi:hypothetical protein
MCNIYKHLGIKTAADLSMSAEINSKTKWYKDRIGSSLRTMIGDQTIKLDYRKNILTSLLISGILYGSSTWSKLTKQEESNVYHTIMKAYRLLLPSKYSKYNMEKISDTQVLTVVNLPTPQNLLRIQKLSILNRLIIGKHTTILYLIGHNEKMNNSWINIVIDDIQQLWPIIQDSYDVWDIEDRVLPNENTIKQYLQNHLSQDIKKIRNRLFTWDANRHYMQKEENENIIPTFQCDLCEHIPYKKTRNTSIT